MVYVYDHSANAWLVKDAAPLDPMPGTMRGSITMEEFMGPVRTELLWSDLRALLALQKLQGIAATIDTRVRYAFRRVAGGAHTGQSAHYAGLAFDIGKHLTTKEQESVMGIALERCGFSRVEPLYSTPGWVHVEFSIAPPASLLGGYPVLREGHIGAHVFLLQDVLLLQDISAGALTGTFSSCTAAAVRRCQQKNELPVTGSVDGATWNVLMRQVKPAHAGKYGDKDTYHKKI